MDAVAQSFWQFIFQMFQGIGQVGSVIVAFYAVHLVQRYAKKRDEAEFIRNRWNEQAQINIACLQSDDILKIHEEIVYGDGFVFDGPKAKRRFVIFAVLNQTLHLYIAMRHGVLSRTEFDEHSLQSLKLLKRQEQEVTYLLDERGYSTGFRDTVLAILARVTPAELPYPR